MKGPGEQRSADPAGPLVAGPLVAEPVTGGHQDLGRARDDGGQGGRDDGQAAIETVGLLSLILLCFLGAMQLMLAGYCVETQDAAVRSAARAASQDEDAAAAARRSMPDWLADDISVSVRGESVTTELTIPSLLPGIRVGTVHRSAVYPHS
jgi:hypothetical protein